MFSTLNGRSKRGERGGRKRGGNEREDGEGGSGADRLYPFVRYIAPNRLN